ncbi:Ral guanine nucleotide dissociation stimulator-like 1 [Nymphon striatum]|nr:Ral guanine nucleotide dissociation stimulator-like 1 [Nymphon striatum]
MRYTYFEENKDNLPEDLCDQHKKTVKVAVSVWLDSFYPDFHDPPHYKNLHLIIDFAKHLGDSDLEIRTRHRLGKFYKEDGLSDSPLLKRAVSANHIPLENGDCSCMYDQAQPYSSFFDIPNDVFARQLTRIDADLFRKVIPFHCLGSVWSKRDKTDRVKVESVEATINQFNAVLLRVIATVLANPSEPRLTDRAKAITKWIDIAQEVRMLKNFSTLKAIISALQSYPIHRLKFTWSYVAKEKLETFNELAAIFSVDNNRNTCRTLLLREGTAKSAKTVGVNDKHLVKVIQKQMANNELGHFCLETGLHHGPQRRKRTGDSRNENVEIDYGNIVEATSEKRRNKE